MSDTEYEMMYWGGIPGRGEFVRLAFEATGTPYKEVNDPKAIVSHFSNPAKTNGSSHFAPPILRIPASNRYISQTPAILAYLAPRLGLAGDVQGQGGDGEEGEWQTALVNQYTLTALDLNTEAHYTHHPVGNALYYEDQKPEALRHSEDFRKTRIPKYLNHFESALAANPKGTGFLVGTTLTTADLAVYHVLDGTTFAFPKAMARLKGSGKYDKVFALYEKVKGQSKIKAYLASDRRQAYGMGIFRHYPELDDQEGEKFD